MASWVDWSLGVGVQEKKAILGNSVLHGWQQLPLCDRADLLHQCGTTEFDARPSTKCSPRQGSLPPKWSHRWMPQATGRGAAFLSPVSSWNRKDSAPLTCSSRRAVGQAWAAAPNLEARTC